MRRVRRGAEDEQKRRGGEEERKKGGQEEKRGENRRGKGEERVRGRRRNLANTLQAALAHSPAHELVCAAYRT